MSENLKNPKTPEENTKGDGNTFVWELFEGLLH